MSTKLSLVIYLSLLMIASGQICTREGIFESTSYKMDPATQLLAPKENTVKRIVYVCCEGYEVIGNKRVQPPKCKPICNRPCGHGICYAPNMCFCDLGYELSNLGTCVVNESGATQTSIKSLTTTKDEPICDPACGPHGFCYDTNRCACLSEEYKLSNLGTCVLDEKKVIQTSTTTKSVDSPITTKTMLESDEPICDPPCGSHGYCYETNRCACDGEGYKLSNLGTCILDEKKALTITTQPSTIENSINQTNVSTNSTPNNLEGNPTIAASVSKCGTCHQGHCSFGLFCVCPSGYNLNPEGNCQPICSKSCPTGRCIAPNRCECADGYSFDSDSLECKPMCNGKIYGCSRGTCVGYNQCECDNGTVLHKNDPFKCIAGELLEEETFNGRWYLILLLLPAAAVVICFYIITRRAKHAKSNRLDDQDQVRHVFITNTNPSGNESHHLTGNQKGYAMDAINFNDGTLQRSRNVVIINT